MTNQKNVYTMLMSVGLLTAALTLSQSTASLAASDDSLPQGTQEQQQGNESDGMGSGRFMKDLNLSSEQIGKLRQNRSESQKQMIKMMADMKTLQVDLSDEMMKDKTDMGRVQKLADQMGKLHSQMIIQRVKGIEYLKSILNPEQKQKLKEIEAQHVGMWMGMDMGKKGMMRHWDGQGKGGGKGKGKNAGGAEQPQP